MSTESTSQRCAALSGLWLEGLSFPGLTPWAFLSRRFAAQEGKPRRGSRGQAPKRLKRASPEEAQESKPRRGARGQVPKRLKRASPEGAQEGKPRRGARGQALKRRNRRAQGVSPGNSRPPRKSPERAAQEGRSKPPSGDIGRTPRLSGEGCSVAGTRSRRWRLSKLNQGRQKC